MHGFAGCPGSNGRMGRALIGAFALAALLSGPLTAANPSSRQLLYVLDTDGSKPFSQDHLLVVDPERKVVVRRYEGLGTGFDFALSPDGTRLYLGRSIESTNGENLGKLDVIDAATGAVLATADNPDRYLTMGPYRGSQMALSSDGRWLYVHKFKFEPGHGGTDQIAIFNTADSRFLLEAIPLPKCSIATFVPWPDARALSVVCIGYDSLPQLRTVRFSEQGAPAAEMRTEIPIAEENGRRRPAAVFVSGENEVTVLMTDGMYARLNVESGRAVEKGQIAFLPPLTPPGWHPQIPGAENVPSLGRRVIGSICQSQGKLYMTLSRTDRYMHAADAIAVVDAKTLRQEAFFELKSSFWNPWGSLFGALAVGNDGKRLYLLGINPKGGTIRILNLADGTQIDSVRGLGASLTAIIPTP